MKEYSLFGIKTTWKTLNKIFVSSVVGIPVVTTSIAVPLALSVESNKEINEELEIQEFINEDQEDENKELKKELKELKSQVRAQNVVIKIIKEVYNNPSKYSRSKGTSLKEK